MRAAMVGWLVFNTAISAVNLFFATRNTHEGRTATFSYRKRTRVADDLKKLGGH